MRTIAEALDRAGVWAIAVGHGDGLGASSIQYGRPLHSDAELLAAAAEVVERARIAIAILPGIGTKRDLEAARDAGATRGPGVDRLHRGRHRPRSTSGSRASSGWSPTAT